MIEIEQRRYVSGAEGPSREQMRTIGNYVCIARWDGQEVTAASAASAEDAYLSAVRQVKQKIDEELSSQPAV